MSIKIENTEVMGWEAAVRGCRNPLNSWAKSDSLFNIGHHGSKDIDTLVPYRTGYNINGEEYAAYADWTDDYAIGKNDLDLMMRLAKAGSEHRKFMRMIVVYADITAPLYWWKEFDTYKVGTVANSCSTMHKIAAKEFTLEDFSCEHLNKNSLRTLEYVLEDLNHWRNIYINGGMDDSYDGTSTVYEPKDKDAWWQMIQLLPSSYNQRRTVMMNFEVLANIYHQRKDHKLDEWAEHVSKIPDSTSQALYSRSDYFGFCDWIKTLPYSELITGKMARYPECADCKNEGKECGNCCGGDCYSDFDESELL